MRVSEAKSSGLFGNGARLPAMVSRSVIDVAIAVAIAAVIEPVLLARDLTVHFSMLRVAR